ncbi:MAG: glycosyltransferase family 2 protein [Bryobacteraceae bacterium]|jgi:GT2 family glycosyltransferase
MRLSIVILCWNDLKVISECLRSIYSGTHSTQFEVIVSDNGSTDGSVEFMHEAFPRVRVIENGANLRFSKGNNVGIRASTGEYVLILNPDTIIHEGSLDRWLEFADRYPEAGGFGCRVLNPDGSYQGSGRPFPTIWREWLAALYLRPLGHVSDIFTSDRYVRWKGETERAIDWQSGCCLLVRAELLKRIGGFDERFYYYYEDLDLCHRIWDAGYPIVYTPEATITHLGGQSTTERFPIPFELDKYRNRYRYFYKYFGRKGVRSCRRTSLVWIRVRQIGYGLMQILKPSGGLKRRLELYRAAAEWNRRIDPVQLVEKGKEPETDSPLPLHVPQ